MAKQEINTEMIQASTRRLVTANDNINRAFGTLSDKMKRMEAWRGAAGTAAQTTMYQLFKNNVDRSAVLENYINLLRQQVDPGYQNTEEANKKLADNFK